MMVGAQSSRIIHKDLQSGVESSLDSERLSDEIPSELLTHGQKPRGNEVRRATKTHSDTNSYVDTMKKEVQKNSTS